jgi:hypothetical protein
VGAARTKPAHWPTNERAENPEQKRNAYGTGGTRPNGATNQLIKNQVSLFLF